MNYAERIDRLFADVRRQRNMVIYVQFSEFFYLFWNSGYIFGGLTQQNDSNQ